MSGGLSRRAAVLAPVAIVTRTAVARRSAVIVAATAVAGAGRTLPFTAAASATAWPARPMRLVVPFAPGGSTDLAARPVAQGLGHRLGQPIVTENRPGAGAMQGGALVAASARSGHRLVMFNLAGHAVPPALYTSLRHDPVRDFARIGLITSSPLAFVSNSSFAVGWLAAADGDPPGRGAGDALRAGPSGRARRGGWRVLARGVHRVRPPGSGALVAADAGFRRGRRMSGAAGQEMTTSARAPAGRGRDATKPRRNPA
jgi:Tripartite tricarboxylate transporter family receptor